MKIISGKYKGKILKGFDIIGTRPTMDRVKESVFAMIQDYIKGSIILDLYSGTGNLGIESISNGALKAYLVDNNKIAINTIKNNVNSLNIKEVKIINKNAKDALNDFIINNNVFDIIFLDPPYYTYELNNSLFFINNNINILSCNGIIICETEIKIDYSLYDKLYIFKERTYGTKKVTILKRK